MLEINKDSLKPIPKIETLEDYIKANFEIDVTHRVKTYNWDKYFIQLVGNEINIWEHGQNEAIIATLTARVLEFDLSRQIKILDAFLGRENEN